MWLNTFLSAPPTTGSVYARARLRVCAKLVCWCVRTQTPKRVYVRKSVVVDGGVVCGTRFISASVVAVSSSSSGHQRACIILLLLLFLFLFFARCGEECEAAPESPTAATASQCGVIFRYLSAESEQKASGAK